ncbi:MULTISPECIES: type I-F CRISPR-associated protein Csy3 [Acinetobacter]|jgi:CRISPR-associated protein Csy3|uniref:CRISPR type I-f/ypest-associated protein csy3 n=1 Tax=Acinetobacter schindleri CIP 107287 TaxID=1217988 RepID=N9AGF8_9GAMM|nr:MULTISPECIES: type I-F CRISPR-associated protein Csy3 [Acinetobacter]ENV43128.1 CRISPR type I-f/ypest-associated protein csy3 [Acinetobacter schindleri CIP 107287]RAZ03080.1 type I-F CRISPR-associated protein Csy3 [Acinetobacter sp. SM1B]
MAKNEKAVASVLAFEKKLVPSDGYFYGTTWANRTEQSALKLIEKSVRGTISNRLKAADADPLKLDAKVENANLQIVDACALAEHQDTLKVAFTLKVLGGIEQPSACNNETFLNSYKEVAKNYIQTHGFVELAKRYALNIANARFLWRNRVGAEKIEVVVKVNESDAVTFNAFDYKLHDFDCVDAKVQNLADQIAQALKGEIPYLLIKVEAYALVGKAQEVYPSEELVLDKGKGDKSKILYQVNDVAAMHSQKIGNALRTIDTWYPDFEEQKSAIAIEPYGAVTNLGKAYRTPKAKQDFFSLFDKYALGESLENIEQEHYVMAVLVRGGVFGQSSKD